MNQEAHPVSGQAAGKRAQLPMAHVSGNHQHSAAAPQAGVEVLPTLHPDPPRTVGLIQAAKPGQHYHEAHQRAPALPDNVARVHSSQRQVLPCAPFEGGREQSRQSQVEMAQQHRQRNRRGFEGPQRQAPR